MPAGLQVYNANGLLTTDIQDRLTVLYAQGSVNIPYNVPSLNVNLPGITNDLSTWYVACTNGATASPGNGYITFVRGESSATVYYSVFRR